LTFAIADIKQKHALRRRGRQAAMAPRHASQIGDDGALAGFAGRARRVKIPAAIVRRSA